MNILNLSEAPEDALERIVWLSGVDKQVKRELDAAYQTAYFDARLTGRLEAALKVGPHTRWRVLGFTRKANEASGRTIRWGDGQS